MIITLAVWCFELWWSVHLWITGPRIKRKIFSSTDSIDFSFHLCGHNHLCMTQEWFCWSLPHVSHSPRPPICSVPPRLPLLFPLTLHDFSRGRGPGLEVSAAPPDASLQCLDQCCVLYVSGATVISSLCSKPSSIICSSFSPGFHFLLSFTAERNLAKLCCVTIAFSHAMP